MIYNRPFAAIPFATCGGDMCSSSPRKQRRSRTDQSESSVVSSFLFLALDGLVGNTDTQHCDAEEVEKMNFLSRFNNVLSPVFRGGVLLQQTSTFRGVCLLHTAALHTPCLSRRSVAGLWQHGHHICCHSQPDNKRFYSEICSESGKTEDSVGTSQEEPHEMHRDNSQQTSKFVQRLIDSPWSWGNCQGYKLLFYSCYYSLAGIFHNNWQIAICVCIVRKNQKTEYPSAWPCV